MCHVSAPGPVLLRGDGHRVLDPDLPPVPHPVSPVQRSVQYTNLARKTRNVRKSGESLVFANTRGNLIIGQICWARAKLEFCGQTTRDAADAEQRLKMVCKYWLSEMCDYNLECFTGLDMIWCWPAMAGVSLVSWTDNFLRYNIYFFLLKAFSYLFNLRRVGVISGTINCCQKKWERINSRSSARSQADRWREP